ncbi:Zn-ribbon domain-containing OB-fold protein [Actinomadura viridis]|uniref:Zn-ribbon domain-containing OB-fold protein n=1 Tax=Actinomadura viridis TaxID=58110 RepID=UPI0036C4163B
MATDLPGVALDTGPAATAPHAVYQSWLDREVLAFQACGACGNAVFPPRSRCPHCGRPELGWRRSRGHAVVYSATTIEPRGGEPYCVALVDLAEGYRMMTNVVGVAASDVRIGDQVTLRFEHRDGTAVPVFGPGEEAR